jgi:hypothetical protein
MAEHLGYWDYDSDELVSCSACGWSGPGSAGENIFHELLDVTCPQCDTMLLIVSFPTLAETRAAAAAGKREAMVELRRIERANRRQPKVVSVLPLNHTAEEEATFMRVVNGDPPADDLDTSV